jgi:hypothetical protein
MAGWQERCGPDGQCGETAPGWGMGQGVHRLIARATFDRFMRPGTQATVYNLEAHRAHACFAGERRARVQDEQCGLSLVSKPGWRTPRCAQRSWIHNARSSVQDAGGSSPRRIIACIDGQLLHHGDSQHVCDELVCSQDHLRQLMEKGE